jgi:hypothetical protein
MLAVTMTVRERLWRTESIWSYPLTKSRPVEVVFRCTNGRISGQAELYVTCDVLSKLAKTLRGFRPSDDPRVFELGTFNETRWWAQMHFYRSDAAGTESSK